MDPVPHKIGRLDKLVAEIAAGRRRLHQLPGELSADDAAEVRRRALEQICGSSLDKTGRYGLDASRAASVHCENFLGAAQIPVGAAGPLQVRGEHVGPDDPHLAEGTDGAEVRPIDRESLPWR